MFNVHHAVALSARDFEASLYTVSKMRMSYKLIIYFQARIKLLGYPEFQCGLLSRQPMFKPRFDQPFSRLHNISPSGPSGSFCHPIISLVLIIGLFQPIIFGPSINVCTSTHPQTSASAHVGRLLIDRHPLGIGCQCVTGARANSLRLRISPSMQPLLMSHIRTLP